MRICGQEGRPIRRDWPRTAFWHRLHSGLSKSAGPITPRDPWMIAEQSSCTVCIRLCDAGPLYSSLLQNHIQIIIWGVSPQYHRTCARLWSRYLHRLKADALQAKGAKVYRDGVCQQRHQVNDRKKKLFSYVALRPLLRGTCRPPERWCSRHPRRQTTYPPHGLSLLPTPPKSPQPNQCFSTERPPLTRPHGRCQPQVEPHAKDRGQAGGSLMVGGWCAVRWPWKLSRCVTTGAHALCLSQQSHGMTSVQCI